LIASGEKVRSHTELHCHRFAVGLRDLEKLALLESKHPAIKLVGNDWIFCISKSRTTACNNARILNRIFSLIQRHLQLVNSSEAFSSGYSHHGKRLFTRR